MLRADGGLPVLRHREPGRLPVLWCVRGPARRRRIRPGSREERKAVTVLFADLAGFTSRAETLDPEDVRAFLHPYYDTPGNARSRASAGSSSGTWATG